MIKAWLARLLKVWQGVDIKYLPAYLFVASTSWIVVQGESILLLLRQIEKTLAAHKYFLLKLQGHPVAFDRQEAEALACLADLLDDSFSVCERSARVQIGADVDTWYFDVRGHVEGLAVVSADDQW